MAQIKNKNNLKNNIMKNYTIIYSDFFNRGSQTISIVKMAHITCEESKLIETIEADVADMSCVHFILDGHCTQSED